MRLEERKQHTYRYADSKYSDELIDKVIELFYTLKDNRSSIIGERVGLKGHQVLTILNKHDDNAKAFEKERNK